MQKIVFLIMLAIATVSSKASAQTVVSTANDAAFRWPLAKTDTVVQVGSDSRNRFVMHRVVKVNPGAPHKGTVILLPSLISNFKEYTFSETGDAMNSLAATLALANFDVYGFSPRPVHVPTNGCSSGAFDCSVVSNWGLATYVSDINYIKSRALAAHPGEKPVVGGFSLGSMQGIAAINDSPNDYSGLIMWDGILYTSNPALRLLNTANCQQDLLNLATGTYYNEGLPNTAKTAANTGEAALVQLFGTPNPVLGTPDFIVAVPNLTRTQFEYSDFQRIKISVQDFNSIETVPILRDVHCSLAGDQTFTHNLSAFRGDVFVINAGKGYGPYSADNVALFSNASSVEVHEDPAFGHGDAYFSLDHSVYVETPLLNWLNNVVF